MTKFKSQGGEDKWIAENWDSLNLPDKGFFVELGAGDGEEFSNTYWLEKEKGWHGLLIEADPRLIIRERPNSIIEGCFVGPPGIVSFGLWPHLSSGALRVIAKQHLKLRSIPLSDLLKKHSIPEVDLISIDTEGTEMDVWKTLDLSKWKPKVAIIELVTASLPDIADEVIAFMKDQGYNLIHTTEWNGIFKNA